MSLLRPRWLAISMLCLAVCVTVPGRAQTVPTDTPPDSQGRTDTARNQSLSESVRRFGQEYPDARILNVEPVLLHGRNLNRIKSLDSQGRIWIHIDDPQPPHERADGDEGGR